MMGRVLVVQESVMVPIDLRVQVDIVAAVTEKFSNGDA